MGFELVFAIVVGGLASLAFAAVRSFIQRAHRRAWGDPERDTYILVKLDQAEDPDIQPDAEDQRLRERVTGRGPLSR